MTRLLKDCANAYFISNPTPYGIGVVCSKRALPQIDAKDIQSGKRTGCRVCMYCPDYEKRNEKNG